MIFDIILYILLTILVLLVIIVSIKITLEAYIDGEKQGVYVKILCFKLDILKILEKKPKTSDEKKGVSQKTEKVKELPKTEHKNDEKDENIKEKKRFKFDSEKIDDYLDTLSDALDILENLAFCFTIKKLNADISVKSDDNAKLGNVLGAFWVFYGSLTAFLYNNFLIKQYKVNFSPIWDQEEFEILPKADIIIYTRIFRVLINIKYKKIKEIRKRDLL